MTQVRQKSSVEEIKSRFDNDVDRFSDLNTGQLSTMYSLYCMDLIAQVAASNLNTGASRSVLDIGCGAGNYSLKINKYVPGCRFTLIDLSDAMLVRARERLNLKGADNVTSIQGDIRSVKLDSGSYNVIVAAAVLHHLRSDLEWEQVIAKILPVLSLAVTFLSSIWCCSQTMH